MPKILLITQFGPRTMSGSGRPWQQEAFKKVKKG